VAGEPYATNVRDRSAEISHPVCLKVLVGQSPEWIRGPLLLLGDAAHPMAPVRAQGINLALRDAIVAANYLVPVQEHCDEQAFAAAGAAIQRERQPEIAAIQALQLQALHLPAATAPVPSAPIQR
jgi:2-polyprenyl-6-methoxyphenol hydroxylase-like FAD-dependent oxidoreductase